MRPLLVTAILLAVLLLAVAGAMVELVRGHRPALLGRAAATTA